MLRTGQLKLGELKAARAASDVAYAAVVMFTNAYALLNPDREEAVVLVKRMQEDLEYFRRYAMPDPNRSRDTTRIVRATRNPTATTSRSPPRPPNNHAIVPRIIAQI